MPYVHSRRPTLRVRSRLYSESNAVFSVTFVVKERAPVFTRDDVARGAVAVLQTHASRRSVVLHAFCIMPDHVHIILSPSSTCDVSKFVGEFKNLSQRAAWKLGVEGAFWQDSFWDRAVLNDAALARQVAYVLNNPVEAKLVTRAEDYPYSFSRFRAPPTR